MGTSENIICSVSLINAIGWTTGASEEDQDLLAALIKMYSVWERTCFLHGGVRKDFSEKRPANLKPGAHLHNN